MRETALPGRLYQPVPGFEDHLEYELGVCRALAHSTKKNVLSARFLPYKLPCYPLDSGEPVNRDFCVDFGAKIHKPDRLLGPRREPWGPFFYAEELPGGPVFWHRNTWLRPFRLEFTSISEAAAALRGIQRNWAPALFTQFRRGALIQEKLPVVSGKRRPFPWLLPETPLGAWTLLDAHTLAASPVCSSPFPGGIIEFEEDKEGPPSRAYLKLWEALVRLRSWPLPGERCLDAGASPGGWTWALARLGAELIAVDRAPLEERVRSLKGVTFIKHDAFTLRPAEIGPLDWLFCDVVSYPGRLWDWLEKWLASGLCRSFVCTIKMQGPARAAGEGGLPSVEQGLAVARRLAEIPGSTVVHLYHNRHELTWLLRRTD